MPLAAGTRIGPYEIVSALGAGGMGEVYRGRDTKLGRDVAIKMLPERFASDAERSGRFAREAQLLAALNHAHIAGIYGLEEDHGSKFLILEFIDGVTLADRLGAGPLTYEETLTIARQIVAALEAAHDKGIVHRDLKPANIMLTAEGQVKVLDFGLARAAETELGVSAMNAPTLTFAATGAGVILGTAAYMAPEQARGKTVDKRADIWAFGVVLFEMLGGVRPFGGDSITDSVAAIIKDEPAWNALPRTIPPALRSLIRRTLEKDPRQRLRDIGDARLALEEIESAPDRGPVAALVPRAPGWLRLAPWALTVLATIVAVIVATRSPAPPVVRSLPLKYTLPIGGESLDRTTLPVISPDGRHVAFVRNGTLWVRALDQLEPRQLGGTDGAQFPFWSPDSRQIAYLTAAAVWRVGVDGTPPVRISTYRFRKGGRTPGGVWLSDDTIVFAPAATGTGLFAAPVQGGEFDEILKRDPATEGDFHRPSLLPDGRSLLFVVDHINGGADTIGVLSNGVRKDVLTLKGEAIESPVYSPTGHILYHRETTAPGIWAVPFSPTRLETTGPPFVVAPQGSYPSISSDGIVIYSESSVIGLATLAWVDIKTGTATAASKEQHQALSNPRLSPDGRHVAAVIRAQDEGQFVIVADLERHTHVRLGARAAGSSRPAWRDNRTIVYARNEGPAAEIVTSPADGSGSETVVVRGGYPSVAAGRLVFSRISAGSGQNLHHMLLPPPGAAQADGQVLQQLAEHEWEPALSPDGKLLAYSRGDAGQSEVILRTYPEQVEQWQVSSAGGASPVWSRQGDALYYRTSSGPVMRVEVRRTPSVSLGTPEPVSRPSSVLARPGFDVSPDGTRLLMVQEVEADQRSAAVAVVHDWFAAFRK